MRDDLIPIVIVSALLLPTPCNAQQPTGAPSPQLSSGISATEQFSDNIYATRTSKVPDWVTVIAPYLNLTVRGNDGVLNLGGSAAIGRYATHSAEDYNDYRIYADGQYRPTSALAFFGGASQEQRHEERSSPEARNSVTPTIYHVTRAFGAALNRFDWGSIRIGATFDRFNYDNVAAVGGGIINNDDRDRIIVTAGGRVGYAINSSDELFGMLSYDRRDYRLPFDDFGYRKDSDGIRVSGGLRRQIAGILEAEAYAGAIVQYYSDPRFNAVTRADFGGRLVWTAVPGTTVTAKLERTLQETDLMGASGYVQTAPSLDVAHWIRPDLRVNGNVAYYLNQYNGIARTDQVASVGLGVRRYVTPNLFLGVDLSHTSRESNNLTFNYKESRAMFRAGIAQEPAYKPEDFDRREVPRNSRNEFYAGVQASTAILGSKLEGSRGSGGTGTLQADFAGDAWAAGALAGYGVHLGKWFLALEADISKGSGGWNHAHVPNERIFSVSRDLEYGLSGVIGRTFRGGTMLYGKAGIVAAQFDTDYQLRQKSEQDRGTRAGLRFGIGGSVPITQQLAVRLERSFATFKSYDIDCCIEPAGGHADNFSNDETMTSVGLVYRLNADADPKSFAAKANFNGFYAGLQTGHDALWSRTTGPRENNTTLTADFGDAGVTAGVFGGFGKQIANFYLGGDVEAELAKTHSDHEREPTGRSFSIEKEWTLGASLRAGYVINDTALLYGRIGLVQSGFKLDFERGSNSLSAKRDVTGTRYGAGMEFPISDDLNLRLDYTRTKYGAMSLITPPAQEVEKYSVHDDLFRIGISHTFRAN